MTSTEARTRALPIVAGKVGATLLGIYLLAVALRIDGCYEPDPRVRDELAGRGPQVGERFPAFELPDVDGNRVRAIDLAGAPAVVLFVPSLDWSPPTKARLLDLAAALADHPELVVIVVVPGAQATPRSLMFIRERHLPFRFLVDQHGLSNQLGLGVKAPDGSPTAVPATFVLDASGVVQLRDVRRETRTWLAADAVVGAPIHTRTVNHRAADGDNVLGSAGAQ